MKRRDFIALLGGAAVAWPVAARAQQPAVPVVGYLNRPSVADGLRGRSASIPPGFEREWLYRGRECQPSSYRWGEDQPDRLATMAADLVRRQVNVIAARGQRRACFGSCGQGRDRDDPHRVSGLPEDPVRLGLVNRVSRGLVATRRESISSHGRAGDQTVRIPSRGGTCD